MKSQRDSRFAIAIAGLILLGACAWAYEISRLVSMPKSSSGGYEIMVLGIALWLCAAVCSVVWKMGDALPEEIREAVWEEVDWRGWQESGLNPEHTTRHHHDI